MSNVDDYKQWILSADGRSLIEQLNSEIKTPLVTAHNLIHMMGMMLNPSPAIQKKIESGELDYGRMLEEMSGLLTQVFDVIDFYRQTFTEAD